MGPRVITYTDYERLMLARDIQNHIVNFDAMHRLYLILETSLFGCKKGDLLIGILQVAKKGILLTKLFTSLKSIGNSLLNHPSNKF